VTAPINFANIAPPQLAPPTPGPLSGLGELLASIQDRSAQRAQEGQRIDLERQRLEADKEKSKFDRTTAQNALDLRDLKVKADAIGERYAREFTLNPSPTSADLSETIGRMIAKEDPKLTPYLVDAFGTHVQENQKTLDSVAKRTTTESGARVATSTEAGKIAGENATNKIAVDTAAPRIAGENANNKVAVDTAAPRIAQAQTDAANSKTEVAIHKLQLAGFGDAQQSQRAAAFDQVLSAGLNAGQAADLLHITLPSSIPRDYTRMPKAGGSTAAVAAAKDMATTMRAAAEEIKSAKSPALGLAGRISMNPADGMVSSLVQYGAIATTSSEQQGLASNYLMLTKAITHLTDGTKASNQDVDRMIRAIVPLAAESPDVVAKKLIMIDLLPTVFEANAHGASQSKALDNVIAAATKRGVKPNLLEPFISLRNMLRESESNPTPSDTTSRNQQLINEAIGRRP
jgi:hypothetical protein